MSASALLLDTARRGALHHSIVLHGPDRGALRTLALDLARSLNCLNGTSGDGCNACSKIERGIHPDVHVVSIENSKSLISVDQTRSMVAAATLRPYEGKCKVFIVDPAESMSNQSANALLKTLEEPSRDTIFLLLTLAADLLLPTVRSRSQAIRIAPQARSATAIAKQDDLPIQAARLEAAAERGEIDRSHSSRVIREVLESVGRFATGRETAALLSAAAILAREDEVQQTLALYTGLLRDLAALPPDESVDRERFATIQSKIPPSILLLAADKAVAGSFRLSVNSDPRLIFEQSLLALTEGP